jgi:hypothetical protein|tara:strand:+ start:326 stop:823 length:498 start_codon:yes stop_codon:yes gene_type:complete
MEGHDSMERDSRRIAPTNTIDLSGVVHPSTDGGGARRRRADLRTSSNLVRARAMGGLLTGAAVAETMSLTGAAGASAGASAGGVGSVVAGAGTAVAETVSSLGTYTVAVGTYTVTAPVAVLAAIGVMLAGVASWMAARRFRGRSAETQSLLRGSAYGAGNGDQMV